MQNKELFNHVGASESGFFNRDGVSTTWAINSGTNYKLDIVDKSLQKVLYMICDYLGSSFCSPILSNQVYFNVNLESDSFLSHLEI